MAKRPQRGRTKTRLCPPLSADRAALLAECLLRDTIDLLRSAAATIPMLTPAIAYTPANARGYFASLAPEFHLVAQRGDELGSRLDHVLSSSLHEGFAYAGAINADGPTLPVANIQRAFAEIAQPECDAVFGPSEDGGYYLIALKEAQPRLTRQVQMSTPTVLAETLAIAHEEGLRVALLPPWHDVDTWEDLVRLRDELDALPASIGRATREFLQ